MRWMRRVRRRRGLVLASLLLVALVAAKLHACACTGGRTDWRSVGAVTAHSP